MVAALRAPDLGPTRNFLICKSLAGPRFAKWTIARHLSVSFRRCTAPERSVRFRPCPADWRVRDLKHPVQFNVEEKRRRLRWTRQGLHMHKAAEYRGIAAKLRREAMATSLPQQRQLNLSAAQRWEVLAEEIEAVTAPAYPGMSQRSGWVY